MFVSSKLPKEGGLEERAESRHIGTLPVSGLFPDSFFYPALHKNPGRYREPEPVLERSEGFPLGEALKGDLSPFRYSGGVPQLQNSPSPMRRGGHRG